MKRTLEQNLSDRQFKAAFNQIVEQYSERLYWHIRRIVLSHHDSDDVLQNTFIKVWQALPKYRGEAAIFTWLYRIATNEALAHLRKAQRMRVVSGDDHPPQLADSYFDGDAAAAKLEQAVARLPEKQRLVFNLKYFEEMKYEEISSVLDTSVGALKASYHHAVNKIKNYLKPD